MRSVALLLATLLTACGSSTGPSRALPTGTFTYTTSTGLRGTLTIATANDDGITGTWDVRDAQGDRAFLPEVSSLGWNIDAFLVFAQPAILRWGTHSHRLVRDGDGIRCVGQQVLVGPFTCTLTRAQAR